MTLPLTSLILIASIHGIDVVRDTLHAGELAGTSSDSTLRFSNVVGSNLEGRRFSLPADFEGDLNVVIVAFRREQQADVDTWTPFLQEATIAHPGLRAYKLPTLNRSYRMVRAFIDGGMARGIPSKATREATITLYIDKTPFKQALAITAEDRIVTLLVARDGRVLWRASGRHTPEASAALVAVLDALRVRETP